MAVNRSGND